MNNNSIIFEIKEMLKGELEFNSSAYNKLSKSNLIVFYKTILIYGISLLITIPLLAIVVGLLKQFNIDPINMTSKSRLYSELGKLTFLYVGMIGPLLEECVFRLPLTLKKSSLFTSVGVLGVLLANLVYGNIICFIAVIILFLILFLLIYFYFDFIINKIKNRNYLYIISILSFTVFHITNYSNLNWFGLPFYIILLLPIFYIGLLTTYLRLKIGFLYAIFLHCCINSLVFLF